MPRSIDFGLSSAKWESLGREGTLQLISVLLIDAQSSKQPLPPGPQLYPLSTRKSLGQRESFQQPCLCPPDLGVQAFLGPGRDTCPEDQRHGKGGAGGRPRSAAIPGRLRLPVLIGATTAPPRSACGPAYSQTGAGTLSRRRARAALRCHVTRSAHVTGGPGACARTGAVRGEEPATAATQPSQGLAGRPDR